jgi:hypothetical protein
MVMNFTDRFVPFREWLLDRITGSQPSAVLNHGDKVTPTHYEHGLQVQMQEGLERIRKEVADIQGKLVDYDLLRQHPDYLEIRQKLTPSLKHFDPGMLESETQRLAFWINLYHVLVLDAVITFEVKRSVGEGWLSLMAFFRNAAYNVGGCRVSLNDIEHGILRGNAGHPIVPGPHFSSDDIRMTWIIQNPDPRVHFALNCASQSCPPINVYSPKNISTQLDLAARSFVDSEVKLDSSRQTMIISSIFRWYEGDFGGREGVVSFLIEYLPVDERRAWLSEKRRSIRLRYKPYDWNLNVLS